MGLTLGQAEIRQIVTRRLPDFKACKKEAARLKLYENLITEFAGSSAVTNDRITGRRLGCWDVSESYMNWLYDHSHTTIFRQDFPQVRYNYFVYQYADIQNTEVLLAYQGGYKPDTTMHALFTLAANEKPPAYNFCFNYYAKSGIVAKSGGGNHRLLAHVLWGATRIEPDILYYMEENVQPDPVLNKALLIIDSIYHKAEVGYFHFIGDSRDEVQYIKYVASILTADEISILQEYAKHVRDLSYYKARASISTIEQIYSCLEDYRALRNQRKIFRAVSRFFKRRPESDFTYWYEQRLQTPKNSWDEHEKEIERDAKFYLANLKRDL